MMKSRPQRFGLLAFFLCAVFSSAQSEKEIAQGFMDRQLVIGFKDNVSRADQKAFLARYGFRVRVDYRSFPAWFVEFDSNRTVESVVGEISTKREVDWAHANYLGHRVVTTPNDPSFGNSWALNNTGQTINGQPGTNDADIDAPEAWDLLTNANSVTLAIVDSGCRMTHQDLSANIWVNPGETAGNGIDDDGNGYIDDMNGWDFLGNDASPTDVDGHGTNVTGSACARGNNSLGSSGVCWQAKAMILKDGDAIPQVALSAAGFTYAAQKGAVSCNFSTGYGNGSYPVLQAAINTAQTAGMIICVAAGNSSANLNTTIDYPATYTNTNLIVVGASTNQDNVASFSNFGSTHVDLFAPGEDIYTTSRTSNSAYSYVSGTSFSAPITTGAVALMRAFNPAANYTAVRTALLSSVDVKPAFNGLANSNGRLNLFAAMNAVLPPSSPTPDPMTFAVAPNAPSATSITMTATTATAPGAAPIEYKFDLVTSTGSGAASSAWQSSPIYTLTSVAPNAVYSFTVKARNATTLSETAASTAQTVFQPAATPTAPTITEITNDTLKIAAIGTNGNPVSTTYAVQVGTLYVNSSGILQATAVWLNATSWANKVVNGLSPVVNYSVQVKARNLISTETPFGPSANVTTAYLNPTFAAGTVGAGAGGPFNILLINGSSGGATRREHVAVGQPITFTIAQPPTNPSPANYVWLGWVGVPAPVWEYSIGFGIGTLCFTPCDALPGVGNFNVGSTYGATGCGNLLTVFPTPFTYVSPALPFPIGDITFQLVVEQSPGVLRTSNAIILNYDF